MLFSQITLSSAKLGRMRSRPCGRPTPTRQRTATRTRALLAALTACTLSLFDAGRAAAVVLDDFENLGGWTASASNGAQAEIAHDTGHTGMGMRIDFDLQNGGFVIVRKAFAPKLPANYAFKFFLRGDAPDNTVEIKLVDRDGQNVWWYRQPAFKFPTEWGEMVIKKPRIEFAWGPAGGGFPKQIGSIELAITKASGGKGSVWIDDLRLDERDVETRANVPPKVSASTSLPGHEPERVLSPDPAASWKSGALAPDQWLLLDFVKRREYGGIVIDWDAQDYATAYEVQTSDDGENWTTAYACTAGNGGRDYVYMPDAESRYLRLQLQQSSRGQGYGIRRVTVQPFEFSASPNRFFEVIARDAPMGTYPKYFSGRQTYWTPVGVNGDDRKGLLSEDGTLEVDRGGFSLEPFLYADGKLVTWNEAHPTQALADGYLPIPSVTWHLDQLELDVTAFAAGEPGRSRLYVAYTVRNGTQAQRETSLFVALRPFQVLPPWQSLNMVGGVSAIHDLLFNERTAWVNTDRPVFSLTPPDGFGAATFEQGLVTDYLAAGNLPLQTQVADPLGYASGAFVYRLSLPPGGAESVYLAVPLHEADGVLASAGTDGAPAYVNAQLAEVTRSWKDLLDRVDLQFPAADSHTARAVKTTVAYILINRDGPAIHPGPRTYARSWIRDGAITSGALLEMAFTQPVRDFVHWFAKYQLPDGRIPCCVDRRGADPVPEYDSNGQFIYIVAEYYRFTRDIGFLEEMWPAVVRATDFIATLRQTRLTDEYRRVDKQPFFGLLPESISHEGYSSHPVHSYWDDFWALRGVKDAAALATVVGDEEHARAYRELRDAFRTNLYESITKTMGAHHIDFIPGSAELGDFDATSTAIAVALGSELHYLPQPGLDRTFDRYYEVVRERQGRGNQGDDGYTAYEVRNVDALIRLGQRERAYELLQGLLADQRPAAWNEWQEITWRDPGAPHFIGDMPHTWIGSSFIRAVRTMLAYEDEPNEALILAAGVPGVWLLDGAGVEVKRLPTYYGVLTYGLHRDGPNRMRLKVAGDLNLPAGGIVVQPPLERPLTSLSVNGHPSTAFTARSATINEFPAEAVLEF